MALWKPTRRTLLRAGGLIAAPAIIGRALAPAQACMTLTGAGGACGGGGAANGFALKANASAAAATSPATSAIDTSGANLLVAVVEQFGGAPPGIMSDSNSNTWTPKTAQNQAADAYNQIYYCASPTVGPGHTFTYIGNSIFGGLAVQAWSGANVTPFDVENGATATAASLATGSVTPGQNGSLIIAGLCGSTGSNTYAIGSGFTITDSINYAGGNNLGLAMAYFKQGAAAAINPTWSWITSANAAATIAVFKP